MVATRNLFNASAVQCAVELVERSFGVTLDLSQVDIVLTPSANDVNVSIAQKTSVTQGRRYEGATSFKYKKLSVLTNLPRNMVYVDKYPIAFESMASNFLSNYGLLMEQGDLGVVSGNTVIPLVVGTMVNVAPDAHNQIWFETLGTSGRWKAGERFPIYVLYNLIYRDALAIAGDAPNAINTSDYSYQYQITGGKAPYHATIVDGSVPFDLEPETAVLTGLSPESGSFAWKVGVTDSEGNYAEISDSLEVVPGDMAFSNDSALTIPSGQPIDIRLTTIGGKSPKTYTLIEPVPGLSITPQGRITGYLVPSTVTLKVRCVDANNSFVDDTIELVVEGRSLDVIKQAVRNKLLGGHWYQFFSGRSDLGNYKIPDLLTGNDLIWQADGTCISDVDDRVGGDLVASVKIEGSSFRSQNQFVPFANDFTVYLRFRGPVDQPGRFLLGTTDNLNGWRLQIDDSGTCVEFNARGSNGNLHFVTDEGVSETLPSTLVVTKLGRNIWILANNTLKHFVIPAETQIVENALSRLAVGRMYNGTGIPYTGSFEMAAVLRYGLLPDEMDILTNDQLGQQLSDLQMKIGAIPTLPFFFQEQTFNLLPDSHELAGSFTISSGEGPIRNLRFLDHKLNVASTLAFSPTDNRKVLFNFKLDIIEDTVTYLAVTDAKGRVARIRINLVTP